jgi:Ferritin-like domain
VSIPHDHLSDRELSAMTDQLDQLHHDQALPALQSAVVEWIDSFKQAVQGSNRNGPSRRTFLLGAAGIGAGGALLAACGSSHNSTTTPATTGTGAASSPTTGSGSLSGDLAVAATAASLENLGVYAYKAALAAATAGKLGKIPPAVATFAQTAMRQHQDHAQAWNSALTAAGKTAVTATDPALTPTVKQKFVQVTNVTQLAQLALLIENVAAQTYQAAIPALTAASSVAVAATIHPVEMQHAAILYYALGQYPGIQGTQHNMYSTGTPLAFNPTALARPSNDYTGG